MRSHSTAGVPIPLSHPFSPPVPEGALLLTGATGFVGMEVLAAVLERSDRHVVALIRAEDDDRAAERLAATLETSCGEAEAYADRVTAVAGDITAPRLGLGERWEPLAERVGAIVHGAASVAFDLSLEESRRINVDGTRQMLDFAAACPDLERFTYVSTAYVAGDRRGTVYEDDPGGGARSATPTSARSTRPSASSPRAATRSRSRSSGRASSSATSGPGGPRRSTSSTRRCARSRPGSSRSSRPASARRSTSSRSTTSPTPSTRCPRPPRRRARRSTSSPGRTRRRSARSCAWRATASPRASRGSCRRSPTGRSSAASSRSGRRRARGACSRRTRSTSRTSRCGCATTTRGRGRSSSRRASRRRRCGRTSTGSWTTRRPRGGDGARGRADPRALARRTLNAAVRRLAVPRIAPARVG